mmetsp:Transcript_1416/g.3190  ORF Transcript_1416/g.3190 Transcript_1416/m.3190 type:complete len:223 (+) Transcript_1416:967-1635(+)
MHADQQPGPVPHLVGNGEAGAQAAGSDCLEDLGHQQQQQQANREACQPDCEFHAHSDIDLDQTGLVSKVTTSHNLHTIFEEVHQRHQDAINGVLLQDPHLHNHHALRDVANQNTEPYHKENEENEAKPKHKALSPSKEGLQPKQDVALGHPLHGRQGFSAAARHAVGQTPVDKLRMLTSEDLIHAASDVLHLACLGKRSALNQMLPPLPICFPDSLSLEVPQ